MEKCGSSASATDGNCALGPQSGTYRIVLKLNMNDVWGTVNTDAYFDIRVGVDCREDYFSFDKTSETLPYYLRNPAVTSTYSHMITQYAPLCGL